jgi:hypothetical protein
MRGVEDGGVGGKEKKKGGARLLPYTEETPHTRHKAFVVSFVLEVCWSILNPPHNNRKPQTNLHLNNTLKII